MLQLFRVPEVLIFSTIQPVMFVVLFRFVFGGSISTGLPGVDY
ncbi:MAG: ABC transporter permease, partial [Actinomycetota bacterium]